MNLNRLFLISFIVLILSSYQTDSSILFTLLMKLLMIKGALFMSMPLGIGAFVMGQGMGFFAGNMMGGYMMLRAANRYHNKEKSKWVSHSQWHGPPYYTNNYQKGYEKGKAIVDVISAGQQKFKAIGSIFKAFVPTVPPKYKYGPPGHGHYPPISSYGSYSEVPPSVHPPPSYGAPPSQNYGEPPPPHPTYGAPPSQNYGAPPPPPHPTYGAPPPSDLYGAGSGSPGPMHFNDFLYPGGGPRPGPYSANRKNAFSNSLLNSIGGGGGSSDLVNKIEEEKNRRSHLELPSKPIASPSGFYTSAYGTPGQEFTGILTNEPTKQGDKYLRGEADTTDDNLNEASTKSTLSSVTSAPNEILESYLEQRLKAEAEKQKDLERKEEAQQLVQMLRKAYLKQLVQSLKDEEVTDKQKQSRNLESSSSPFGNLITSSIENLLGSRDSRSIEHQDTKTKPQQRNYNEAEAEESRQTTQNLIRDLLVNEVFSGGSAASPKGSSTEQMFDEQSTSTKVNPSSLDNIDTAEVESITERVLSLTSAEREELVKGLDELGQDQEESVISRPRGDSASGLPFTGSSSTENSISSGSIEEGKIRDAREALGLPAEWIPIDSRTYSSEEMLPFGLRVRRQISGDSLSSLTSGGVVGGVQGAGAEEQKQIQSFVDDIRKFFTLLSALDQDQCLQKLVCDVHTNEKDISTLTQYELNILTTFKLMKALMPEGEEDSSTKYRYAALVGETGQSMDLCQQQYSPCQVDSSQIVQLGSAPQPTPDPNDAVASNPLMMNLASLQQQSEAAAQMAFEAQTASLPTTSRPTTTTTIGTTTTSTTVRPRTRIRTRGTTTTTMTPLFPEEITNNQRRNYVESNQYHNMQEQRRKQTQQYFQQQQQYNNHHQPSQYNRRPSHSQEDPSLRPEGGPQNSPGSSFFNYGDFSDFFRGMWSDTKMGGGGSGRKRRRGQMPPRSEEIYNQYWTNPELEEIGI